MQATRVTESPDEPGGELVLWIELPSALLVGHAVVATGEGDAALVRVLHAALERPAAGPPRRPARLRVAESSQAFALRGAGIDIPIDVGFSPEIEDVVEQILATMRDSLEAEACGFLDGGLSPALMGDLFASARTLHASAPWRLADDAPDVRLDIPDLGVEGACVVMMGGLGRSTGLLAFPSLDDYDAFLEACDACETEGGADFREHLPGDASWLSLSLLPAAEVTEAMRREVVEHGWTPPADGMLPVLTRFERGDAADLDDRDVCVAAACADALSLLVVQHPEALHDDAEPLSVTYRDPHGLDVRVTLPYESFEDFEPRDDDSPARRAPARKIGRNEPCFCGSGRKYKQCHLRREQDVADRIRRFSELLELDVRVLSSLVRFAVGRFGAAMLSDAGDFVELGESDLSMHWFAHDLLVEGRSVSDWALDARELSWTAAERGWIRSQDRAWLSLWLVAVRGADGAGELRDLLSGATRRVSAVLGKSALEPGRVCLGRVVEHAGTALLSGVHSRSLPAAEADAVVRDVRAMFRRTSDIPIEHLRPARVARRLVERWTEALLAYDERVEIDLPLSGPEASAVVDLFVLRFGALHEVGEALARLRGVEAAGSGTDHSAWRILEPSPTDRSRAATRLVGRATLTVDLLRVGWVDEASADRWRVRLESVCEDALKHARRVRGPHEVAPGTHDAAPRDERSRQLDLGFGAAPAAEGPRAQGIPE